MANRHTQRILVVTNMYPSPTRPWCGTFVRDQVRSLEQCGLTVEIMTCARLERGYGAYRGLGAAVKRRVQQQSFDLVHVMYGGVMARAVVRALCQPPVMVSFCGSDLFGEHYTGLPRRFIARLGVWASHAAAHAAAGVVVKSQRLAAALPRSLIPSKVRVIPNGLDLHNFHRLEHSQCRAKLGWPAADLHVLFPANTGNPVKRPWLASLAIDQLNRSGLQTQMHYLRGVAHDEVPLWLSASDVLLLTSLHEGSPNIVKEALACNLPVVSVDVGDVAERIQGIKGCYLAAPEARDLADKMRLVFLGPRQVHSREKIATISLERIAQRLIEFYDEVVARPFRNQSTAATHTAECRPIGNTQPRSPYQSDNGLAPSRSDH